MDGKGVTTEEIQNALKVLDIDQQELMLILQAHKDCIKNDYWVGLTIHVGCLIALALKNCPHCQGDCTNPRDKQCNCNQGSRRALREGSNLCWDCGRPRL
jgi:hypothetical protein